MRGQAWSGPELSHRYGITPADAGTSCIRPDRKCWIWDHPRGCGDKLCTARVWQRRHGSPPPMRGQGHRRHEGEGVPRITPADAGTSFHQSAVQTQMRDHPRGCGDKYDNIKSFVQDSGSPPRMRGQVLSGEVIEAWNRITPADAGTSDFSIQKISVEQDHPRGCGDKF